MIISYLFYETNKKLLEFYHFDRVGSTFSLALLLRSKIRMEKAVTALTKFSKTLPDWSVLAALLS